VNAWVLRVTEATCHVPKLVLDCCIDVAVCGYDPFNVFSGGIIESFDVRKTKCLSSEGSRKVSQLATEL
jgi:hypothetical protein